MKAVLFISGFSQRAYEDSGMRRLWLTARKRYAGPDTLVLYGEWNSDFKTLGKHLSSLGVSECAVCAYSWGAGYGLKQLAKGFSGRIYASLCDPVYYSPIFFMRWLAMFNRTIRYPDNVEVVQWYNQKMDEPGGDPVKAKVKPRKPITLPYPHSQIDDSPQYAHAVNEMLRTYISKMTHNPEDLT